MCELISVFSVHSITCFTVQVFTEISTAPEQAPLLNNCSIWDKKANKCWPRISTVVPMKDLFKEFRPKKKTFKSNTGWEISLHQSRCSSVQSDCIARLIHQVKCRKSQMETIKRLFC